MFPRSRTADGPTVPPETPRLCGVRRPLTARHITAATRTPRAVDRTAPPPFCESYDIPTLLCTFGPDSSLLTFSRVAPSSLAFVDGCHSTPPIRESGAAHDRTSRPHLISSHMDWTSSLAPLHIWCQIRRAERRAAMRSHARRPRFVGLDAADAAAGKPRFGEGLPDPEIEGWAPTAKSCSMLASR